MRGRLGASGGPWHVVEPPFARGASMRALLERAGVATTDDPKSATAHVVAIASRVPLDSAVLEEQRADARAKPTALVGLQNDAFLDDVPEAALRISASDAGELARGVVARRLAAQYER